MTGRFKYHTKTLVEAADKFLDVVFAPRCGGMNIVVRHLKLRRSDKSGLNKVVFVVHDARNQLEEYEKEICDSNSDYFEKNISSGFVKILRKDCFCYVVTNKNNNTSIVFFDGVIDRHSVRVLIGIAPLYFPHLFSRDMSLSAVEKQLCAAVANWERPLGDSLKLLEEV